MHYLICYDIESDRKRGRIAKSLLRHGCERVQKSVFVAANMEPKHLSLLLRDLRRFFPNPPLPGAMEDSVLLIPLPNEQAGKIIALGCNNAIPDFEKILAKIL